LVSFTGMSFLQGYFQVNRYQAEETQPASLQSVTI
jgi:hypothetical protein